MPTYKNISNDDINLLYEAVARFYEVSLAEAQTLVDEYLQGQTDRDDLLADIDNELDWIPTEQDAIDTAISNVPIGDLAYLRNVIIGILEHDRRMLQENLRMIRAWKFVIKNIRIE